jgi:hypothetical protein
MAHEAFALSPISARATQPSEEDYDAISAAFMETARGRWFLGEFAKRNRSVDTRLVLDAVARIEQTLVAQNEPDPDTGRVEALAAIKVALDKARAAASLALDSLALEGNLTPVRKGTRIIKEISWRWREIGADGRICDLIDSQLSAIEASCDQISSVDPRGTLSAAFDLIDETLAVFDEVDHAAAEAGGDAVSSPSSNPWAPPQGEMPAATTQRGPAAAGKAETGAVAGAPATPVEPAAATVEAAIGTIVEEATAEQPIAEAIDAVAIAADATANTEAHVTEASVTEANTSSDAADMTAEAADAHDDAVLDLIAAEMAAPDPSDEDDDVGNLAGVSPPAAREPIAVTSEAPAASVIAPAIQPSLSPSPQPSFAKAFSEASGEVSDQISLGSTLVANGIVRKPATSAPDPLAAIRRLSQAEKIALFS